MALRAPQALPPPGAAGARSRRRPGRRQTARARRFITFQTPRARGRLRPLVLLPLLPTPAADLSAVSGSFAVPPQLRVRAPARTKVPSAPHLRKPRRGTAAVQPHCPPASGETPPPRPSQLVHWRGER